MSTNAQTDAEKVFRFAVCSRGLRGGQFKSLTRGAHRPEARRYAREKSQRSTFLREIMLLQPFSLKLPTCLACCPPSQAR